MHIDTASPHTRGLGLQSPFLRWRARRERSALYSRTMRGRGELARHALPNARNRYASGGILRGIGL